MAATQRNFHSWWNLRAVCLDESVPSADESAMDCAEVSLGLGGGGEAVRAVYARFVPYHYFYFYLFGIIICCPFSSFFSMLYFLLHLPSPLSSTTTSSLSPSTSFSLVLTCSLSILFLLHILLLLFDFLLFLLRHLFILLLHLWFLQLHFLLFSFSYLPSAYAPSPPFQIPIRFLLPSSPTSPISFVLFLTSLSSPSCVCSSYSSFVLLFLPPPPASLLGLWRRSFDQRTNYSGSDSL